MGFNLPVLNRRRRYLTSAFSPASLFTAGEQGYWLDPSDFSTMFQDAAGTTPVTAVGQSVRRILDKSGRGNHFTQANVANAPILGREPFGGRRNLLTFTEQFDNAVWSTTATSPFVITKTATEIAFPAITHSAQVAVVRQAFTSVAGNYTGAVDMRAKTAGDVGKKVGLWLNDGSVVNFVWHTLTADWVRVTVTEGMSATSSFFTIGVLGDPAVGGGNQGAVTVEVRNAQLETGSTATAYQRVTTAFDVTQAGVPDCYYLAFDGSDDWLQSAATINPGAVDKAQVFAGVRKLSDAATAMVLESSANAGTNAGSILLMAPAANASATYGFYSRGSVAAGFAATSAGSFAAPITSVITGLGDIAADSRVVRVNGAVPETNTSDQGTGNYLTYTHFIGRRAGTLNPFNGRIYQMIVRYGPNLAADQIAATETFVNQRTGAF